jgi:hypothetical protein
LDIVTFSVSASLEPTSVLLREQTRLIELSNQLQAESSLLNSSDATVSAVAATQAATLARELAVETTSSLIDEFLSLSSLDLESSAPGFLTKGYFSSPSIISCSASMNSAQSSGGAGVNYEFDILAAPLRALPYPGQANSAGTSLRIEHGLANSLIEQQIMRNLATESGGQSSSSLGTINALLNAGAQLLILDNTQIGEVATLPVSAEAKARITAALLQGLMVIIPIQVGGTEAHAAWFEYDPSSGMIIAVSEDGSHGADFATSYGELVVRLNSFFFLSLRLIATTAYNQAYSIATLAFRIAIAGVRSRPVALAVLQGAKEAEIALMKAAFSNLGFIIRGVATLAAKQGIEKAFQAVSREANLDPPLTTFLLSPNGLSTASGANSSATIPGWGQRAFRLAGSACQCRGRDIGRNNHRLLVLDRDQCLRCDHSEGLERHDPCC